ncbi:hypothetical protein REPUB_Repub12eG0118400 [Reevesia pubescens]
MEETVLHILKDCVCAQKVCYLVNLDGVCNLINETTAWEWCKNLAGKLDQKRFDMFLVICWAIWSNRNNEGKNQRTCGPQQTANFALKYMQEFQQAQDVNVSGATTVSTKWIKLGKRQVKVNFDCVCAQRVCNLADLDGVCNLINETTAREWCKDLAGKLD